MNQSDLSEVLARVQVKRIRAAHYFPDIDGRLLRWGVAVVEQSGWGAVVPPLMGDRSPQGQWWVVRSLLPDSAIWALERKLDGLLESAEHGETENQTD